MKARKRDTSFILRWASLFFMFAAMVIVMTQLVGYSRQRSFYPLGMSIGGVQVGGLDPQAASERLLQVYTLPVELRYGENVIHLDPTLAGFKLDMEAMLAAADLQRVGSDFWVGFWDYLWGRTPPTVDVPLRSSFSRELLVDYLQKEIAPRYDEPPTPAQPIPGSALFEAGKPGQELDVDRAATLIEDALRSPTNRIVSLSSRRVEASRPSLENLEIQLKQIIDINGFDGVAGIYMHDLQTGDEIHFGYRAGENIPVSGTDITFTASSTIKIPILITVYRELGPIIDSGTAQLVSAMIKKSENPPSDALMEALNPVRGPLLVTETAEALGLQNTFLAGFFYPGAPLLLPNRQTPGNSRTDVFTDPDLYNQTSPSEMGYLLEDIYDCARNGGGALVAAFPGRVNQQSCAEMIEYLKSDRIGVLIEAGVPDGTQVAHKHGWVTNDFGVIQNISDAAIVYTPGGDYVLTIYLYHPIQAVWEPTSLMVAQISQAVYNYFNLPGQ